MRPITLKGSYVLASLILVLLGFSFQAGDVSGNQTFIPAVYRSNEVCASKARGKTSPGRIEWDQASLYAPIMKEYDQRFTFAHELFHAVQFAYPEFRELWCGREGKLASTGPGGWLLEGMADAAALDWARSQSFPFTPPLPGSIWRYAGQRYYSYPLNQPKDAESYYATSSFWLYLRDACGNYSLWHAVMYDDASYGEGCPAVRGKPVDEVKPGDWIKHPVLILDRDAQPYDAEESEKFISAFNTAAQYYRAANFKEPWLLLEDTKFLTKSAFVIRDANIENDAGETERATESENRPGGIGPEDADILRLVDRNLSYFLSLMCTRVGDVKAGSQSGYCEAYAEEGIGGLAVAYLAFINEFSEGIITGEIPYPSSLKNNDPKAQLFEGGCTKPNNGEYRLNIPELASSCIQLSREYSTSDTYYVIASGLLDDLDRLQLGWHGCPAAPLGTEPDSDQAHTGQKFWVLRPHLGRPGCTSKRDDYTLVFSNIARRAEDTTAISGTSVTIEATSEYQ